MKNHHFFLLALISYSALAGPERNKLSINFYKDYVSYRNIILGQQVDQIQSREKGQWAEMVDQKTLQNYEMINIHLDSANKFLRQAVFTLITENNQLVIKNNQLEKQINELQNNYTQLQTASLIENSLAKKEKKDLVFAYDAKIKEQTSQIYEEKKKNKNLSEKESILNSKQEGLKQKEKNEETQNQPIKILKNSFAHQWYSPLVYIGTGVLFTAIWSKLPSFGKGPISPK